jgi:LacI family transcriptional regulator
MRRQTQRDIAAALGLSVNTVSRALSGKDSVSEETRRLIRDEAERVGYVVNLRARSLVLGSAMTIGLMITNPSNPFYAQLISAIELRGRAAGYSLLLVVTEESEENESAALDALLRSGVDGAIVVPVQGSTNPWARAEQAGVPIVLINRDLPGVDWDFVGTDNRRGAYEATQRLIQSGVRNVVMLEEDLQITTITERIEGFSRAMKEAGLAVTWDSIVRIPTRRFDHVALPWHADEAYQVAKDMVTANARPDAFVVGNDYFALGLYRALAERQITIPTDVRIVGFGDYPFAGFLTPPLTTVRLPAAEVGTQAVHLLLERLRQIDRPTARMLVPPTLIIRSSA